MANGVHHLSTDTLKMMLSNTTPLATNAVKADIAEIPAQGGYMAGGFALTDVSSGQTFGLYKLVIANITITGAGGAFGPFRYVVLYNSSTANGALLGWYDYGSSISLNIATDTFTTGFDQTNGVIQLQ